MKKNLFKLYRFWFLVLGAFYALNAFSEPVVESRSAIGSNDYPFTTQANVPGAGDSDVVETTVTTSSRPTAIPDGDGMSSTASGSMSGSSSNSTVNASDPVQSVNAFNAIQQEVQELRGSIEELQFKLQQLEQQQKDRYINIDQRLRTLEGGSAAVSAIPVDGATTSVNSTTNGGSTMATEPSGNEKADYDAAFNLMTKDKNFDKATKAFSNFVDQYPMGFYTPNAWYWLGKLYSFDTKNLTKSRDAFQKVVLEFPTNTKASDALYELGVTYDKLGEKDQAKKTLKAVPAQYPGTGAAVKAQQYLKEKPL